MNKKVPFSDIFINDIVGDYLVVLQTIKVGGVKFDPGTIIGRIAFNGICLLDFIDRPLSVREEKGFKVLTGIY